jgi:hypothetical protein
LAESSDIVVEGLQGHGAGSRENVCYLGVGRRIRGGSANSQGS